MSSFNFKKTKVLNKLMLMFVLFVDRMFPLMLNIRSTAAELAGTPKYFLANSAKTLNLS